MPVWYEIGSSTWRPAGLLYQCWIGDRLRCWSLALVMLYCILLNGVLLYSGRGVTLGICFWCFQESQFVGSHCLIRSVPINELQKRLYNFAGNRRPGCYCRQSCVSGLAINEFFVMDPWQTYVVGTWPLVLIPNAPYRDLWNLTAGSEKSILWFAVSILISHYMTAYSWPALR